jgi:DNA modification methylase
MKINHTYIGDSREIIKTFPDESINCVVTSPPYFGLRSYLEDDNPLKEKEVGLEKTPEEYVENMVLLFRELKRVLRKDGTVWINLGDSYNGSGKIGKKHNPNHTIFGKKITDGLTYGISTHLKNLKPKDLIGIPWKVAFALQTDGWYLRQDIIWSKPNPMPESITDRCTKSHEYIFLLSKSQKYFFDYIAIQEKSIYAGKKVVNNAGKNSLMGKYGTTRTGFLKDGGIVVNEKRNKRSIWTVNSKPYKDSHFAVFPPKLIEPCILAGCPHKVCSECGNPWERVMKTKASETRPNPGYTAKCTKRNDGNRPGSYTGPSIQSMKWQPTCTCNKETRPGIVLDPFFGSGTTGTVAAKFGRDYVGIDLNENNLPLIKKRRITKGLFSLQDLQIK